MDPLFSKYWVNFAYTFVEKNSILLVDFTHKKREEGFEVSNALKMACPNRLRPILMTTFSTTAGAIPLALSLGPMAIAIWF